MYLLSTYICVTGTFSYQALPTLSAMNIFKDSMPHYTKEVPSANQHAKTTHTTITTTTITNMLFHSLVTL